MDSSDDSDRGFIIGLWIMTGCLVVILIVAVVFLIIYCIQWGAVNAAVNTAFSNNFVCSSTPLVCEPADFAYTLPTSFPNAFDKTIAMFCGQMVANIENQTAGSMDPATGLTVLGNLTLNETNAPIFGYVAVDTVNRAMYIFCRGTLTETEWQNDLLVQQLVVPNNWIGTKTFDGVCDGVQVHKGFADTFEEIVTELGVLFAQGISQVDRVIVSGHSLGAAISSMISLWASYQTTKPVYTYCFAKPRVGNMQYQSCVNAQVPYFWRITNESDLIPTVPWAVTPNLQNTNAVWLYGNEGINVPFNANYQSWIRNHLLPAYLIYVNSL